MFWHFLFQLKKNSSLDEFWVFASRFGVIADRDDRVFGTTTSIVRQRAHMLRDALQRDSVLGLRVDEHAAARPRQSHAGGLRPVLARTIRDVGDVSALPAPTVAVLTSTEASCVVALDGPRVVLGSLDHADSRRSPCC
jgi:hypothetical protein